MIITKFKIQRENATQEENPEKKKQEMNLRSPWESNPD